MTVELKKTDEGCEIVINDEMTIYTAATLKQELLEKIADCSHVDVSLAKVSEMDTSGLQLMLLLHDEAKKSGQELHFTGHSPAVIDVLETLNLVAHFADPIVMPAQGGRS
jgi:anti-sigma B factor antagonist